MLTISDSISRTLADLRAAGLYRRLVEVGSAAGRSVELDGRPVLLFASNNYLGLAADERVRAAARRAIDRWGWGAGASPLVSGHTEAHAALERDLAAFKHAEAAIVFPTGYQANLAVLTALAGRGDLLVMDRANHASLYDGARLSGARLRRYAHADAAAATRLLNPSRDSDAGAAPPSRERTCPPEPWRRRKLAGTPDFAAYARRIVATDTVFSMDGDLAPLAALSELCAKEGTMLVLDEAHATGVLGPTGAGLAEALGLEAAATASVGTLSKALGGLGGFVAASRDVCDLLVNRARPYIYTTALPAAACEAARAALAIVRTEPERRLRLADLGRKLRAMLVQEKFDIGEPSKIPSRERKLAGSPDCDPRADNLVTPIVPVIIGDAERALAMAAGLLERGIFCPAIRPPTVPAGTSRLRISLTCEHTEDDLARLVEALVATRAGTQERPGI